RADRPRTQVFDTLSDSGRKVTCTGDHPFLTPSGMRPASSLKPGDRIAVSPFEGIPYETPVPDVIGSEATIRRTACSLGKSDRGRGTTQAINHLGSLLPLTLDHAAMPVLMKVAGVVLGDGSIHFDRGVGKGHVTINGCKEDL